MSCLSVIVPLYNEAPGIVQFHERLRSVLQSLAMDSEVLYVDDGSDDATPRLLDSLCEGESDVGYLRLSRNFGKEAAMSAGLDHVRGDAVIIIDGDLQDPPELIGEFVEQWRNGYDVVYGKRISREGESWFKRQSAALFYRLLDRLSDVPIPRDVGDYRLLSRRAVEALKRLREQHRYMKGLFAWIGYPQKAVPYARAPRADGRSKWNYGRLWNFALEGITSFSAAPLKLATWLGLLTSLGAFGYGLYFLLRTLLLGNPVPGYPSLVVIILFLGGVQLVCLGIIGEYLARTYNESKGRALYFVQDYRPGSVGPVSDPSPASSPDTETRDAPHA